MSTLEHALEYHSRGWSIIPIRPGSKLPACAWKPFQGRRADEQQIRKWFANGSSYGLAVILGDVSGGLICRDYDIMDAYRRWVAARPALARQLPTAATHRGRHVYGRGDTESVRKASRSGGGIIKFADGELRAGGGYCLLPPSVHPDGAQYRWEVPLSTDVPRVDLHEAGFFGIEECNREHRDGREHEEDRANGEYGGQQRTTEAIDILSVLSALSVASPNGLSADIERAIAQTLPTGPGQRHRQVFELARALKAIPALSDAEPSSLRDPVRRWHELAKAVITTQPFEETWIDFIRAWPKVKFPKGAEPMAGLFARAAGSSLPEVASQYEQAGLRLLVSLCREMQRTCGDGPFYLSCRTAGRLLHVEHTTAWRWLFLLESDHVLDVAERGGSKTQRATRYRYLGD